MGRRAEFEPLTLADAPDVLDKRQIARIMRIGVNYAGQLVREGYLVNIGGTFDYRVPKSAVAKLLEEVGRGEATLPVRKNAVKPDADRIAA